MWLKFDDATAVNLEQVFSVFKVGRAIVFVAPASDVDCTVNFPSAEALEEGWQQVVKAIDSPPKRESFQARRSSGF